MYILYYIKKLFENIYGKQKPIAQETLFILYMHIYMYVPLSLIQHKFYKTNLNGCFNKCIYYT